MSSSHDNRRLIYVRDARFVTAKAESRTDTLRWEILVHARRSHERGLSARFRYAESAVRNRWRAFPRRSLQMAPKSRRLARGLGRERERVIPLLTSRYQIRATIVCIDGTELGMSARESPYRYCTPIDTVRPRERVLGTIYNRIKRETYFIPKEERVTADCFAIVGRFQFRVDLYARREEKKGLSGPSEDHARPITLFCLRSAFYSHSLITRARAQSSTRGAHRHESSQSRTRPR